MDYMTIDSRHVPIEGEKNILSVIRKAGIDLPTFCYHSELSIYGACRMCVVEDDRGRIFADMPFYQKQVWHRYDPHKRNCTGKISKLYT